MQFFHECHSVSHCRSVNDMTAGQAVPCALSHRHHNSWHELHHSYQSDLTLAQHCACRASCAFQNYHSSFRMVTCALWVFMSDIYANNWKAALAVTKSVAPVGGFLQESHNCNLRNLLSDGHHHWRTSTISSRSLHSSYLHFQRLPANDVWQYYCRTLKSQCSVPLLQS